MAGPIDTPERKPGGKTEIVSGCLLCITVLIVALFLAAAVGGHAAGESPTKARIVKFIKGIYPGGDAVQVRLNSLPSQLREKVRIVNMNFVRIPDVGGDGICAVEIESAPGRTRTVQVPFKIFTKRELFVLKQAAQKGDAISARDIHVRVTYMNGKGTGYPQSAEDIIGKVFKRDVPANTLITDQLLEDRVVIKRGEVVTIIAESDRLVVRAKGKTVDKGRIGETIRVKNLASGKELMAKVVSGSAVKVEF